jgi:hypothetical protein
MRFVSPFFAIATTVFVVSAAQGEMTAFSDLPVDAKRHILSLVPPHVLLHSLGRTSRSLHEHSRDPKLIAASLVNTFGSNVALQIAANGRVADIRVYEELLWFVGDTHAPVPQTAAEDAMRGVAKFGTIHDVLALIGKFSAKSPDINRQRAFEAAFTGAVEGAKVDLIHELRIHEDLTRLHFNKLLLRAGELGELEVVRYLIESTACDDVEEGAALAADAAALNGHYDLIDYLRQVASENDKVFIIAVVNSAERSDWSGLSRMLGGRPDLMLNAFVNAAKFGRLELMRRLEMLDNFPLNSPQKRCVVLVSASMASQPDVVAHLAGRCVRRFNQEDIDEAGCYCIN